MQKIKNQEGGQHFFTPLYVIFNVIEHLVPLAGHIISDLLQYNNQRNKMLPHSWSSVLDKTAFSATHWTFRK